MCAPWVAFPHSMPAGVLMPCTGRLLPSLHSFNSQLGQTGMVCGRTWQAQATYYPRHPQRQMEVGTGAKSFSPTLGWHGGVGHPLQDFAL